MTVFAGDEDYGDAEWVRRSDVEAAGVFGRMRAWEEPDVDVVDDEDGYGPVEWSGYCYPGCPDDVCRAEGCCAWQPLDESALRPVRTIETTGDAL